MTDLDAPTELDLAHREIERLRAEIARLEQVDTHVEYGVGNLPNAHILQATPIRSVANSHLREFQKSWPEARLVQRLVRRDPWTETTP